MQKLQIHVFDLSKGYIWSKMESSFDWWEIEVIFKVTGRGRVGADGLVSRSTQR